MNDQSVQQISLINRPRATASLEW